MAISVKDLKPMDEISIRTQNNVYKFTVTDPTRGKGVLSGGLLGEVQHEAALCYFIVNTNQQTQFSTSLETGRSAFFFVRVKDGLRRLTTSVIQDVSLTEVPTQAPTGC